ncbi:MAG: hypothetical protein LCH37_15325 [Bacteroidetes bacterium]|nr:hypothetical protein [Bacteroidota bacterium]
MENLISIESAIDLISEIASQSTVYVTVENKYHELEEKAVMSNGMVYQIFPPKSPWTRSNQDVSEFVVNHILKYTKGDFRGKFRVASNYFRHRAGHYKIQ